MTGVDARGMPDEAEKKRLSAIPAGAVMLFKKNLATDTRSISLMNAEISAVIGAASGVRPFIACDHEGGGVHRFTGAVRRLPPPASYYEQAQRQGTEAALAQIRRDAAFSAAELRALGITMNLAPLAEPLTGQNQAFLGTRAYGPDPNFAGKAAAAFIRGMEEGGVTCVLKHFPGNTGDDPHFAKPVWNASAEELRRLTAPFSIAVADSGAAALMVSHVIVPAWDAQRNASLSPVVIKKLREEYGFNGIIIADDFAMGAVSGGRSAEENAVEALRAGVDMVMAWPATVTQIHRAILRALATGALPRARLEEAAARILKIKSMLNLF